MARFLRAMVRPIDSVAIVSVSTDVIWQQPFTADLSQLLSAIERLNAEGATALYDAVEAAASALNRTSGRRVIVILSDGRDTISRATLASALKRTQEADAVVYAINTSGRPASANVRELAGERALERLCNQTGGEVFFPDKLEELDPDFARLTDQLRTQYVLGFASTNEARDGSYRRLTVRVNQPNLFARAREGYYALKQ
jgi:Ca-activated chloride channel family protein